MQIKEITWADSKASTYLKSNQMDLSNYRWMGKLVIFHERQAVETFIETWSRFESQPHNPIELKSDPVVSEDGPYQQALISEKK